MDRVARCRRAAREAVADVGPPPLQDVLLAEIDDAPMTPAALAIESAAAVDPDADLEAVVAPLAAGAQLIYDGLRLTRRLSHEEPWVDETGDHATDGGPAQAIEADLTILAADILVARGFYLLARTDAADAAVRTVRAFGRDQTARRGPNADAAALDAGLERDVLELAVRAGAAAVDREPSADVLAFADELAERGGSNLPPVDRWLSSLDPPATDRTPSDGLATDRATSATDP